MAACLFDGHFFESIHPIMVCFVSGGDEEIAKAIAESGGDRGRKMIFPIAGQTTTAVRSGVLFTQFPAEDAFKSIGGDDFIDACGRDGVPEADEQEILQDFRVALQQLFVSEQRCFGAEPGLLDARVLLGDVIDEIDESVLLRKILKNLSASGDITAGIVAVGVASAEVLRDNRVAQIANEHEAMDAEEFGMPQILLASHEHGAVDAMFLEGESLRNTEHARSDLFSIQPAQDLIDPSRSGLGVSDENQGRRRNRAIPEAANARKHMRRASRAQGLGSQVRFLSRGCVARGPAAGSSPGTFSDGLVRPAGHGGFEPFPSVAKGLTPPSPVMFSRQPGPVGVGFRPPEFAGVTEFSKGFSSGEFEFETHPRGEVTFPVAGFSGAIVMGRSLHARIAGGLTFFHLLEAVGLDGLREPLLVIGEFAEVQGGAIGLLVVGEKVFVTHLEVIVSESRGAPGSVHEIAPDRAGGSGFVHAEAHALFRSHQRTGNVAAVPDHVEELRAGEESFNRFDVHAVAGILIQDMGGSRGALEHVGVNAAKEFGDDGVELLALPKDREPQGPFFLPNIGGFHLPGVDPRADVSVEQRELDGGCDLRMAAQENLEHGGPAPRRTEDEDGLDVLEHRARWVGCDFGGGKRESGGRRLRSRFGFRSEQGKYASAL